MQPNIQEKIISLELFLGVSNSFIKQCGEK